MADPVMPQEVREHIEALGWPEHHARWHYEQRYDFWRHLAAQGVQDAIDIVADGDARAGGGGRHRKWRRGMGWSSSGCTGRCFSCCSRRFRSMPACFAAGRLLRRTRPIPRIRCRTERRSIRTRRRGSSSSETRQRDFPDEDEYALFLETSLRPTPEDPTWRLPDGRTNLHNYLHNRWSDDSSPVNIVDPWLNLGNARFWRLHGWIDRLWTLYREAWGLDDEPGYRALIDHHRDMMARPPGHGGGHGHHDGLRGAEEMAGERRTAPGRPVGPSAMSRFFAGER
ncbi:MAG TPA: hypothetical protein VF620_03880 [Allosphingosinicella sp.]|jgi:hypothetical protein